MGTLIVFKYYDFVGGTLEAWARQSGSCERSAGVSPARPRGGRRALLLHLLVRQLPADVHAARLPPERHLGHFALYVSFFPKLLAGPIERAQPFLAQIRRPVAFSSAGVALGLRLMLWGLFKKVVIADRLAAFVDAAYAQPAFSSPADLVLATYFFAFQLYCDFSGYSDMAIGAAKVLGVDVMENFRRPYFSTSVPEFWSRRWHCRWRPGSATTCTSRWGAAGALASGSTPT